MSDDGVSPAKVLGDAVRLLTNSLGELVPPEAQRHLLNAQCELLAATSVIIEHNSGRTPRRPRADNAAAARASRRPKRVELD